MNGADRAPETRLFNSYSSLDEFLLRNAARVKLA
jgi:hypothetical protein